MGHILGFEHYEYDYKFKGRIRTGELLFLKFCSSEKAEYYTRVESEEPLNFIVVPNIRVNYAKDCYETKTRIFEKECLVDVSGGLIIEFPYSSLPKISKISVFIKQE